MIQPEELLKQIGLTKSEAKLYLASLTLGPASVIQLGQKTGHTRQMVYTLLPILIEKGLIKQTDFSGHLVYQAVSPEILLDLAREITGQIQEIVPILKTQRAEHNAIPTITVYENPLAMREWYKQFTKEAKKDEELLIWSSSQASAWHNLDREFYEKYLDVSEEKGVKTHVMISYKNEAEKFQDQVARTHTKHRFVKNPEVSNLEKWIWRDQVGYLSIRGNATNMIVLQSKDLAELDRFNFWNTWNSIKMNY